MMPPALREEHHSGFDAKLPPRRVCRPGRIDMPVPLIL